MLFRSSILLGAVLVASASFIAVTTAAVSSASAANPSVSPPQPSLNPSPILGAGEAGPAPSTLEERVALFKVRVQEWAPPPSPHRRHAAPAIWQTPAARVKLTTAPANRAALTLSGAPAFATEPASLAALRASGDDHCLATAIYYEARNQPLGGQEAVAQVIMNRVGKPQFANSVCGVVAQGGERRGCQFSFVCDGSMSRPPRDAQAWATAEDVAARTLQGTVSSPVGAATFYHASYVSPWWSKVLPRVAQIGAHIFYNGLDAATSGALRGTPLIGAPLPLLGPRRNNDAPLLPGGLLGGA